MYLTDLLKYIPEVSMTLLVNCFFVVVCLFVLQVVQSCLTLWDPMDYTVR